MATGPEAPRPTPSDVAVLAGLRCDIDRGPNWLFAHLDASAMPSDAAAAKGWCGELLAICDRHFTYRLVIEMDEVESLAPVMSAELTRLDHQLAQHGGGLKLSGVTPRCQRRLDESHSRLRSYGARREAVLSTDSHESVVMHR